MHTADRTNHTDRNRCTADVELVRAAAILRDFYLAPLSLSSVQPLLHLAERLNPDLRERAS